MKKLLFALIMMLTAAFACKAAPQSSQGSTVYYIVMGSYSKLSSAQSYNYSCPDGLEGSVVMANVNGKTMYRICTDCFYSKKRAQEAARNIRNLYGRDAWVWPCNVRARIVSVGKGLNGQPIKLNPR